MSVCLSVCELWNKVFGTISIAYGVQLCCIVLGVPQNNQSVCLSFEVWPQSVYIAHFFAVCVCVDMTIARYWTISSFEDERSS